MHGINTYCADLTSPMHTAANHAQCSRDTHHAATVTNLAAIVTNPAYNYISKSVSL